MWIFLNDAMVSIVRHRTRKGHMMVRARLAGDLERTFPGCTVQRTPNADYAYRTVLPEATVVRVMGQAIKAIDYPNFKSSIPFEQRGRARTYHRVWDVMMDAQLAAEPDTGRMGGGW